MQQNALQLSVLETKLCGQHKEPLVHTRHSHVSNVRLQHHRLLANRDAMEENAGQAMRLLYSVSVSFYFIDVAGRDQLT